ncbi:hypothetical protein L6452_34925 [Arctium lappa]|uniref:Uncharacterized protein n=1 Tax=Arctium lappa TaxID=4217 RepID=A0ACB8YJL7_ARCLA|nr:hypothetical protein L6452_34925 [Arctium lappa]
MDGAIDIGASRRIMHGVFSFGDETMLPAAKMPSLLPKYLYSWFVFGGFTHLSRWLLISKKLNSFNHQ